MTRRPRRTARQRLADMLAAIERIETYTRDKTETTFVSDPMVRDSVERNIERLSEASRHLPASLTGRHPEIPWRAVADIGNVFRHAYDDVDAGQTWLLVERDLGPLKAAVRAMIEAVESEA